MASLFGSGGQAPAGAVNTTRVDIATMEIDMLTALFNRLTTSCHAKCISTRYAEPDLNKGEGVCIDRCVAKYLAVSQKVQDRMQQEGANKRAAGEVTPFGA